MAIDRRLLAFARQMRHEPSPAEKRLWSRLRRGGLAGFNFRRQHVIEPYIADFYCVATRLVVEVDGDSHAGAEVADAVRTRRFEERGLRVVRFWNAEVYDDIEAVLETIYRLCVERTAGATAGE